MTGTYRKGQHVAWNSHGGQAHGKVINTITRPMEIKGHKVAASPDNPEVETDGGKRAAHKPSSLRKDER